jgi:hypothetical protein
MKNGHSLSRGAEEHAYELPYRLARDELAKADDVQERCRKSGARCLEPKKIVIDYLNQPYHISLPDVEISLADGKAGVPLRDKILILHYLNSAKGTPATGMLITYRQLPGGVSYFSAFSQRAINPLVKHFGSNPELLKQEAGKLGGREAEQGDVSVMIDAFAHVPITLVLWRGDEEIAPSGNVLFDANISDYLSTEDVVVLSETIVWKLVKGAFSTQPGR